MQESEAGIALGHTFHVARENAGFLWLGARIQVIEDGRVIDEATVYGDTLHAFRLHMDAEVALASEKYFNPNDKPLLEKLKQTVISTNEQLPKRFQRVHLPTHSSVGQKPAGA